MGVLYLKALPWSCFPLRVKVRNMRLLPWPQKANWIPWGSNNSPVADIDRTSSGWLVWTLLYHRQRRRPRPHRLRLNFPPLPSPPHPSERILHSLIRRHSHLKSSCHDVSSDLISLNETFWFKVFTTAWSQYLSDNSVTCLCDILSYISMTNKIEISSFRFVITMTVKIFSSNVQCSLEFFHSYDELSVFSRFSSEDCMSLIILRNLSFPVQCNGTRVKLTRITSHVLKTEIIDDKCKNEKILISRISLQSKNDEINKNRRKIVSCQFLRFQFSVRSVFVITVNKSQNQSLRVVEIDIRTRECFTHDQLYVALFRVINNVNLHIITSNHVDRITRRLKNIQWTKMLYHHDSWLYDFALNRDSLYVYRLASSSHKLLINSMLLLRYWYLKWWTIEKYEKFEQVLLSPLTSNEIWNDFLSRNRIQSRCKKK